MKDFQLNTGECIKGSVLNTKYCPDTLNTTYLVMTSRSFYVLRRNAFDDTYKYFLRVKTRNKQRALDAM